MIAVLTLGYILMGSFYATNVGLSSTYNSTALGVPVYDLTENQVTFAAAGLNLPKEADRDTLWVTRAVSDVVTTVNIYMHTIGMIFAVAAVYFFPFVYLALDSSNRLGVPLEVSKVASIIYTISIIIVWNIVHPDLMYILGNNDKIAHWLVTCGIMAQAGLYHAAEHNLIKAVGKHIDSGVVNEGADEELITMGKDAKKRQTITIVANPSVLFFAFIVGSYLYSIVMGVSLFMPVHTSGFGVVPESYQAVFAIYACHQTVEFARFLCTLLYPMIKGEEKDNTFKMLVGAVTGPMFSAFLHVWLLVVVGVFAFFPRTVIMQSGKI